jgi:cell division transport system permease protein
VRSGLDAHRATIEVMHMLGSTDHQVARLFQRRAGADALLGGGIGGLAGLAVAWAAGRQLGETGSELLGDATLSGGQWLVLACLPPLFAALAALAARRAVLADLRRTL